MNIKSYIKAEKNKKNRIEDEILRYKSEWKKHFNEKKDNINEDMETLLKNLADSAIKGGGDSIVVTIHIFPKHKIYSKGELSDPFFIQVYKTGYRKTRTASTGVLKSIYYNNPNVDIMAENKEQAKYCFDYMKLILLEAGFSISRPCKFNYRGDPYSCYEEGISYFFKMKI